MVFLKFKTLVVYSSLAFGLTATVTATVVPTDVQQGEKGAGGGEGHAVARGAAVTATEIANVTARSVGRFYEELLERDVGRDLLENEEGHYRAVERRSGRSPPSAGASYGEGAGGSTDARAGPPSADTGSSRAAVDDDGDSVMTDAGEPSDTSTPRPPALPPGPQLPPQPADAAIERVNSGFGGIRDHGIAPGELKRLAILGRDLFQEGIEATPAGLEELLDDVYKKDPRREGWQRGPTQTAGRRFKSEWTGRDYSDEPQVAIRWRAMHRMLKGLRVGIKGADSDKSEHAAFLTQRNVNLVLGLPNGPFVARRLSQDQPYLPMGSAYSIEREKEPATNAEYASVYNILDGVIVMQSGTSPRAAVTKSRLRGPGSENKDQSKIKLAPRDLPYLSHWSDLTWMEWLRLRSRSTAKALEPYRTMIKGAKEPLLDREIAIEMRSFLNWFVVQANPSTEVGEIVASCLVSRGHTSGERGPTWGQHETYPVGHWCFYALLATEGNKNIAWLLMQHKAEESLGMKMLKSVTIVFADWVQLPPTAVPAARSYRNNLSGHPSLIWEELVSLKETYEALGMDIPGWEESLMDIQYPSISLPTMPQPQEQAQAPRQEQPQG